MYKNKIAISFSNHILKSKLLFILIALLFLNLTKAQNLILNGSFENNLCTTFINNCSNKKFDSLMLNSYSFGAAPNLDIMTSNDSYCGSNGYAQDGNWFLGVSSGGADAFSLALSSEIIQGQSYILTFYDRQSTIDTTGSQVQVGISNNDSTAGTIIYTAPIPKTCQWILHSCAFNASISAKYITVTCPYFASGITWTHVDNFILDTTSTSGIKQIKNYNNNITVFPNPANNQIHIEGKEIIRITLLDLLGNEVISMTDENVIDVSNLSEGIYFVQVNTSKNISIQKIIIQY